MLASTKFVLVFGDFEHVANFLATPPIFCAGIVSRGQYWRNTGIDLYNSISWFRLWVAVLGL